MSEWKLQQHNVRYNLYCFSQIVREFMYAALRSWVVCACDDSSALHRPLSLGRRAATIAGKLSFLTADGIEFNLVAKHLCAICVDLESKWNSPEHLRYMRKMGDEEYWLTHDRSEIETTFTNVEAFVTHLIPLDQCVFGDDLAWFLSHCDDLNTSEEKYVNQLPQFLGKYYLAGRLLSFVGYGRLAFYAKESTLDGYSAIAHYFSHELACFERIYPTANSELVVEADQLSDPTEKHWKLAEFANLFRAALEGPPNRTSNACDERNRLAYELMLDIDAPITKSLTTFNKIMACYKRQPNPDLDYEECSSVQTLTNMAKAYAKKYDLPALPKREGGRPRKPPGPDQNV